MISKRGFKLDEVELNTPKKELEERISHLQHQLKNKNLEAALIPLGWPPEKRLFRGHLTLARARLHFVSGASLIELFQPSK